MSQLGRQAFAKISLKSWCLGWMSQRSRAHTGTRPAGSMIVHQMRPVEHASESQVATHNL